MFVCLLGCLLGCLFVSLFVRLFVCFCQSGRQSVGLLAVWLVGRLAGRLVLSVFRSFIG